MGKEEGHLENGGGMESEGARKRSLYSAVTTLESERVPGTSVRTPEGQVNLPAAHAHASCVVCCPKIKSNLETCAWVQLGLRRNAD